MMLSQKMECLRRSRVLHFLALYLIIFRNLYFFPNYVAEPEAHAVISKKYFSASSSSVFGPYPISIQSDKLEFHFTCSTRRHIRRSTVRLHRSRDCTADSLYIVSHSSSYQMNPDNHMYSGAVHTTIRRSAAAGAASDIVRCPVRA